MTVTNEGPAELVVTSLACDVNTTGPVQVVTAERLGWTKDPNTTGRVPVITSSSRN
jgi:hypothetical protein